MSQLSEELLVNLRNIFPIRSGAYNNHHKSHSKNTNSTSICLREEKNKYMIYVSPPKQHHKNHGLQILYPPQINPPHPMIFPMFQQMTRVVFASGSCEASRRSKPCVKRGNFRKFLELQSQDEGNEPQLAMFFDGKFLGGKLWWVFCWEIWFGTFPNKQTKNKLLKNMRRIHHLKYQFNLVYKFYLNMWCLWVLVTSYDDDWYYPMEKSLFIIVRS